MRRWAEFILARRKWVVTFWVAVSFIGGSVSGMATDRLTFDYSLPGEPGSQTAKLINKEFGNGGYTAPYLISVAIPDGDVAKGRAEAVASTFAAVGQRVPGLRIVDEKSTGDPAFHTRDGHTAYAMVFYQASTSASVKPPADKVKAALKQAAPAGAETGFTGIDVLAQGSESSGGPGVLAETLIGALGALAVLAFVFASMLALLPLVIATASIMTTFAILYPLTYVGDFSALIVFLIALVGLGVAIDYSLILVTRWREERDSGTANHEAVILAMETAGRSVMFSGLAVGIGLLSLLVLPVPFMRSVGVGGALIPLASVAATLSLTPALLGGIGPRVDWPRLRREASASRAWTAWARGVVRYRVAAAAVLFLIIAGLSAAFFTMNIGQSTTDSLATDGPAYDALHALENGGVTPGALTPIEVLVSKGQAPEAARELREVDGVAHTLISRETASTSAENTVVIVVPEHETVNNNSVDVVRSVKARSATIPGVIGVTGMGAAQLDFLHGVYGNFPLMLALISLLTFVLLARAFRSLVLALKAVILNLLSLAATFGIMVLFWQEGFGSEAIFGISATGAITFWLPLIVFAFLFGLSMDYEVFILARMREEYDATGSTNEAVVRGIGRTGRLVSSAALILFLAFAALAAGPGTDLKVMATALGFGILLDATLIRSVLTPALVALFGDWNWYMPDWAAKILRVSSTSPRQAAHAPLEPTLDVVN